MSIAAAIATPINIRMFLPALTIHNNFFRTSLTLDTR